MCMRTNIELNDDLVAEARKYSRAKTKRALIEEALTDCQVRKDPADLLKQDRSR